MAGFVFVRSADRSTPKRPRRGGAEAVEPLGEVYSPDWGALGWGSGEPANPSKGVCHQHVSPDRRSIRDKRRYRPLVCTPEVVLRRISDGTDDPDHLAVFGSIRRYADPFEPSRCAFEAAASAGRPPGAFIPVGRWSGVDGIGPGAGAERSDPIPICCRSRHSADACGRRNAWRGERRPLVPWSISFPGKPLPRYQTHRNGAADARHMPARSASQWFFRRGFKAISICQMSR